MRKTPTPPRITVQVMKTPVLSLALILWCGCFVTAADGAKARPAAVGDTVCTTGSCSPRWSAAQRSPLVRVDRSTCVVPLLIGSSPNPSAGIYVGTIQGQGIVLTCKHVAIQGVRDVAGVRSSGWHKDKYGYDIAALIVPPLNVPAVKIGKSPLPGERVEIIGYPGGRFGRQWGRVTGRFLPEGEQPLGSLQIDAVSPDGYSGGAVLDGSGALVGILWGSDGQGSAAIPAEAIADFLRRLGIVLGGEAKPDTKGEMWYREGGKLIREPYDPDDYWPRPAPGPSDGIDSAGNPVGKPVIPPASKPVPPVQKQKEAGGVLAVETSPPADIALAGRLDKIEARAEALNESIAQSFKGLEGSAKVLKEFTEKAFEKLQSRTQVAVDKTAQTSTTIGEIQTQIEKRLTGSLVQTALPGLITGLGWTGPPALLAMVALRVVPALIRSRRRKGGSESKKESGKPFPVTIPPDEPPPQIVKRQREFVSYRVPSRQLKAIEWAHDEYVRRHPGARAVVETLESYADQYLSGHPDQPEEQSS